MKRILAHNQFLLERDLSQDVDQVLYAEMLMDYYELNEGKVLDTLKNSAEKTIFGAFSKLSIIDTIRKGNLDIQKDLVKKEYELDDDILDLEEKMETLRRSGGSGNEIKRISNQIDRKKKEFRAFVKLKREQMNKGLKLLEKAVGKKQRRKEYYEAGLMDDKYELAKFEYDYAKKKAETPKDVAKAKDKFDAISKKAEDLIKKAKSTAQEKSKMKSSELGDMASIRKKILNKDVGVINALKERTKEKSTDVRKEMGKILSELKSFLAKAPSYEEVKSSGKISKGIGDLVDKANEVDALDNLYSVYSSAISNKKSLDSESSLTNLFSKIGSAISDGNDAGSGITKEVLDIKSDVTLKKIGNLIKKLS